MQTEGVALSVESAAVQTEGIRQTALSARQTDSVYQAHGLEYGDAIIAAQTLQVCGLPYAQAHDYGARHELLVVPAGEGGIVKNKYPHKLTLKVDFPGIGVGFVSYDDIEHFKAYLNAHACCDRMMRAKATGTEHM